jgi:hypothetical protein
MIQGNNFQKLQYNTPMIQESKFQSVTIGNEIKIAIEIASV